MYPTLHSTFVQTLLKQTYDVLVANHISSLDQSQGQMSPSQTAAVVHLELSLNWLLNIKAARLDQPTTFITLAQTERYH